ncbi:MAG: hypothetical protein JWN93_959, partial [Hyphomicrobiales bacterium]|nr:hypothetical protein [Hyphomicrobiales bacterium]
MQFLTNMIGENKGIMWLLAGAALVLAALILVLLYRLIFGSRIRSAGGRARQPRLGVVDAYDLDRQRQLVLVRRDNVEHLVMIGGPNDVLIESSIIRAQSAYSSGEARANRESAAASGEAESGAEPARAVLPASLNGLQAPPPAPKPAAPAPMPSAPPVHAPAQPVAAPPVAGP